MGGSRSARAGLVSVAGAALALCLFASGRPAIAQVIEIRPDGGTVTYNGPGIFSETGLKAFSEPRVVTATPRAAPPAMREAMQAAAAKSGVSAHLLEAVAWQESRFHVGAVSPKGAVGPMQLMPGTARELGVDAADPVQNIGGGAAYLAAMLSRFGGDVTLALAAYNAGPTAVARNGGVPPYPETQAYVAAVLERLAHAGDGQILTGSP